MGEWDAGVKTFSRIFGLSFSTKKIAIQILGILCAMVVWWVIGGIGGLLVSDRLQWLISLINTIIAIFIMFFTWGAIARVTVSEVAELPPVDINGALRAARKSAQALLIAPLKIVAIILVLMLIHVIGGLIGKIPVLGEIIWPFFAIPLFFLSALIVIAKIILVCGALLLPPIIMVGKESPVSELNDFLREHLLRFIGYLIATIIVVMIVCVFLNRVVATNDDLSSWAMGQKYSMIVNSVPSKLNAAIEKVSPTLRILSKSYLYTKETMEELRAALLGTTTAPTSTLSLRWTYSFAGFIWGLFTLLIYLSLSSLPLVIWCVSGTLIYLGLKPEAIQKPAAPQAEEPKE